MKHWIHLKASIPESHWLFGNTLVMKKILDKLGSEVYNMQKEIGDGCPVCFMGDEIIEEVIQEINTTLARTDFTCPDLTEDGLCEKPGKICPYRCAGDPMEAEA